MDSVSSHNGNEATNRGVENNHDQRYTNRNLIRHAEENLEEVTRALEDGEEIQEACEDNDRGRQQKHRMSVGGRFVIQDAAFDVVGDG